MLPSLVNLNVSEVAPLGVHAKRRAGGRKGKEHAQLVRFYSQFILAPSVILLRELEFDAVRDWLTMKYDPDASDRYPNVEHFLPNPRDMAMAMTPEKWNDFNDVQARSAVVKDVVEYAKELQRRGGISVDQAARDAVLGIVKRARFEVAREKKALVAMQRKERGRQRKQEADKEEQAVKDDETPKPSASAEVMEIDDEEAEAEDDDEEEDGTSRPTATRWQVNVNDADRF